jgi:jumonji domain-containing protein 2
VFHPTMKEFRNFAKYIEKWEKQCGNAGAFKVVSPSSWVARKKGYQDLNLTVQRPIEQNVWGNNGIFELMYLLRESRTLEKYEKYVSKFDYCIKQKTNTEVERLFWKTLKLNAPLYGADIEGSLMDPGTPWNLSELDTILKDGLNDQKLSGVNMPYLYVGGWKTMFGWHKEDLDLYSINFLHLGAPKYWYCIDVDSSEDFEKFTQKWFRDKFEKCTEYLRHKNTLVHPVVLKNNGIKLRKIVQKPGEFVVLRATAYHAGFNSGFNLAEAVNFASFSWVEKVANKVKFCTCIRDSVKINMTIFCDNLIDRLKNRRTKNKTKMIKILEEVQKDDIKAKEIFQLKLEYLQQKKDKALENRRKTISRKNRKRVAKMPSRCKKVKRIKSE